MKVTVDFHWTVSNDEHGEVVWSWNLLGCVRPFQCQHPGTHQSLGWTSPRLQPTGCLFHARNGRPHLQSGWVQLQCGSDQPGPPGMIYCREEASKRRHTPIRAECDTVLISEVKSNGNKRLRYGMLLFSMCSVQMFFVSIQIYQMSN